MDRGHHGAVLAVALILLPGSIPLAMPAPPPRVTPGKLVSEVASYWVAPFALYSSLNVGSIQKGRIEWFDETGRVRREIDVGCGGPNGHGYVDISDPKGTTFHSVLNPDWQIFVDRREEPSPDGAVLATSDGRTLVYSSRGTVWGDDEWPRVPTTVEICTEGKRATAGPFLGAPRELFLDASGVLALRFLNGEVVVLSRYGKELYRVSAMAGASIRIRGCSERGLLIEQDGAAERHQYWGFDGTRSALPLTDFAHVCWSDRDRGLFLGRSGSIQFVDCARGKLLWEKPSRGSRVVEQSSRAAILDDIALVASLETREEMRHEPWPYVMLRAFDLEDGEVVASWPSDRSTRWGGTRVDFYEVAGKLHFVDGRQVCEIDSHEIRDGDSRWIPAHPKVIPPTPIPYGPPQSPLAWSKVVRNVAPEFEPQQSIAPTSRPPSSVTLVQFIDERPYGERGSYLAWLAIYDSVLVRADSSRAGFVSLSVAYDADTGNMLCAFTEPKERWVVSTSSNEEMMKRFNSPTVQLEPAAFDKLRSTPAEVLGALWHAYGVNPIEAAQIVLRPRFYSSDWPARRFEGKFIPVRAPGNMWIVEVLGTLTMGGIGNWPTLVARCGDADLQVLQGTPMP